jgi:hypothetical protein
VYTAGIVPGLPAGAQTSISLNATLSGTGLFTVALVLDLNREVDEGPTGEANNEPTFSYKIDKPFSAQGTNQIAPVTNVDFGGQGVQDATWDGGQLTPINGAFAVVLPGLQLNQVHFDYLAPTLVNSNAPIPIASLPAGTLVGMITAEGNRAILRVASYNGANIVLDYFVYAP